MPAPQAPRRPHSLTAHDDTRIDDWYWLRNREDPEVIAHLEAENAYLEEMLAHSRQLRDDIYAEMVARIQETDLSVPARKGQWWYLGRTTEGQAYPISCRRAGSPDGPEQVLLDQNLLAEGHDYLAVANQVVSPDGRLMAYATDYDGSELYTLRVRDLDTDTDLADEIASVYYGLAWSSDNAHLFYVRVDEAMRPFQLWRHRLGTDPTDDVLVHTEADERFFLSVGTTKSERFVVMDASSKVTTEIHVLEADDPTGAFRVVAPREQDHEYGLEHVGEKFFILTNQGEATNFALMSAPVDKPGRENWTEVVAHRPDVKLEGLEVFSRHLVLTERTQGVARLVVRRLADGETHVIDQPEPVYTAWTGANYEMDTNCLRMGYTSMVTPSSVYSYDMEDRSRDLLKQQEVLGGFDPTRFGTRRMWAPADDGTRIPVSVVARRDLVGPAPTLLYAYGAYEASMDPTFSSLRLSLLERGVVFAIAHVRGGGEMGRPWYEGGKLANKPNTFSDTVAAARHLAATGVADATRMALRGGSAGGLLVGAVLNLDPELFCAAVAEVPFVDTLTTMLDETLPLTVTEWEEWGNPVADADTYRLMKSYSPYDNVAPANYPTVLVTAGLNDPRVSYWEPAKWVQRLRACSTSGRPVLMRTEMGAGHGGPSGRYEAWKEEAMVVAFLVEALGLTVGS
ncbi:MAG: S9 family peptidase [Acidimicrobiales bacterium]